MFLQLMMSTILFLHYLCHVWLDEACYKFKCNLQIYFTDIVQRYPKKFPAYIKTSWNRLCRHQIQTQINVLR